MPGLEAKLFIKTWLYKTKSRQLSIIKEFNKYSYNENHQI